MSTETFSEATERVQNAFKETSELFTKTTTSLMDAYSKQLNTGYEFYRKLAETAKSEDGKAKWEDMIKEGTASYQKAINNTLTLSKEIMVKTFSVFTEKEWSPLSKKSTDAILNIFTKQAEQSRDFGTQFLQALEKGEVLSTEALKKHSDRFNELMQEIMKGSETAIKELIASYNEQASYTQEATKKLMTNIQQQTDSLAKTHAKFTEELVSTLNKKRTPADEKQAHKQTNKQTHKQTKSKKNSK